MRIKMYEKKDYFKVGVKNIPEKDIKAVISKSLSQSGIQHPIDNVIRTIIFKELADQIDWSHVWNDLVLYYMPEFESEDYLNDYLDTED